MYWMCGIHAVLCDAFASCLCLYPPVCCGCLQRCNWSMFALLCHRQPSSKPVQVIPLISATAAAANEEEADRRQFVMRIDSKSWVKKGKLVATPRTFWLQAMSKDQLDEWLFLLQLSSERLQMSTSSTAIVEDTATAAAVAAAAESLATELRSIPEDSVSEFGSSFGLPSPSPRKSTGSFIAAGRTAVTSDSTSSVSSFRSSTSTGRRVSYAVLDLSQQAANKIVGGDQVLPCCECCVACTCFVEMLFLHLTFVICLCSWSSQCCRLLTYFLASSTPLQIHSVPSRLTSIIW